MIGNIKEIFLLKTGMREKQLLQDPGYVEGVETTCCIVCCKVLRNIEGVERNKNSHNTVDLRHLCLMSKESKVHSIYNVDFNSKYSN